MSRESTVLLVDDEEDFVAVLAERLEARGLAVDTAANGQTAVEKAEKRPFDAILLDMAMPGMDGIQTLQALLRINPDLQVILLTGRATLSQAVEAMMLVLKIEEAATKKSSLLDKRIADRISDIMRKKGW
jgi:DNA-binding NtrC family response regulator